MNSYAKRDYIACFKQLRQSLKAKEVKEEDIRKIEDLCNLEWKLLRQNESKPTIMLVKRSVFSKNQILGIDEILRDKKEDIGVLASHIMDYKLNSLSWKDSISPNDITFVTIPYAKFIIEQEVGPVEVILPTVHPEDNSEDGKVSFLLLLGSALILLGVVVSIIMFYQ